MLISIEKDDEKGNDCDVNSRQSSPILTVRHPFFTLASHQSPSLSSPVTVSAVVVVVVIVVAKLSNRGGRLIISFDGIWDALSSEEAAKSCRGLPAELVARQIVKEALSIRSRDLKDDTTCIVVDIIPPDNSVQPPTPPKKQNKLKALLCC
ncbi:hypothetical protein ACLB2K_053692 [Fragaria x ananassa]